mgnify:CR=1 FL=1
MSAIESIRLPSTLKRIEYQTFYKCYNLRSVEIPNGVKSIGKKCFQFSEIEEITLPATVKKIDENALDHCFSLRTVLVEEGCTLDVK